MFLHSLFWISAPASATSDHLVLRLQTAHYTGQITELCIDDVACNHVLLQLKLPDGKLLKLRGRRMVAMCSDGVTPCHPLGYTFTKSAVRHDITDEGELRISRGDNTLASEQGSLERADATQH